jgi:hypothetical protein
MRTFPKLLLCVVVIAACGPHEPPPPMLKDVRVPIPAADPSYYDVLGADSTVAPMSERMVCQYLTYSGPDAAFDHYEPNQGKWGHHVVLFQPKPGQEKADGTIEDCSDAAWMGTMDAFAITVDSLPDGIASHLHAGQRIVIQSHYVNTGDYELEIRDVIRLHLIPVAQVTTWGAPVTNQYFGIDVPAMGTQSTQADCIVPSDIRVLQLGGHMHEWGSTYEILTGPDVDHLTSIYSVPDWKPEYRDEPPVIENYAMPIAMPSGTIIRSKCSWKNTTDAALKYPKEMCATFGYAIPLEQPWSCVNGTAPQ